MVGCEYILDSLYTLRSGKVDALVAIPLYEDGYTGMELIDHMLHGKELQRVRVPFGRIN